MTYLSVDISFNAFSKTFQEEAFRNAGKHKRFAEKKCFVRHEMKNAFSIIPSILSSICTDKLFAFLAETHSSINE